MKNNFVLLIFILFVPVFCFAQLPTTEPLTPSVLPNDPGITDDGDCFTMSVNYVPGTGGKCIEISIDIHGDIGKDNAVEVTDGLGNSNTCYQDCTFTWCYNTIVSLNIVCETTGPPTKGTCDKKEGCIVVVGGGD